MTDATFTQDERNFRWGFWPLLPIYPYGRRRTLRREIVPNRIWVFEQIQGIFYVVTPVRMTVIRLEEGGLFVYAPIAPTQECITLLRQLEAEHGEVKYIIHPTASGLEHKVFVGPFARHCPKATIFVAPSQWSFPLNLPSSWLGIPARRTQVLSESETPPFATEFDYSILSPINLNLGYFQEIAMVHRPTQTLLVTDCLVSIPSNPPDVVQMEPYPLLFHAKNHSEDDIVDELEKRQSGWQRIALFSFYFRSGALKVKGLFQTLREARSASDRSSKNYFGLYPFDWQPNWKASFESLSGAGRLLVAPILRNLILNRQPQDVLDWVENIAQWDIQKIIPCHLEAPIMATGEDVKRAFSFLNHDSQASLPEQDMEFMESLDRNLQRFKVTPPAKIEL